MKTLLATLALAVATGCIVRVPGPIHVQPQGRQVEERRCPPGHEWSDGRCHERGRGHDDEQRRR